MAQAGVAYSGVKKRIPRYSGILTYYNYLIKKILLTLHACNFILSNNPESPARIPILALALGNAFVYVRVIGILAGSKQTEYFSGDLTWLHLKN